MLNRFTPLQKKWLEALESGEYDQSRGRLVRHTEKGDRFCCLGVACDLAGLKVDDQYRFLSGQKSYITTLPRKVWRKLHLTSEIGTPKDWRLALAVLNDHGVKFATIAKILRSEPWNYFTNFTKPQS